MVKRKREEEEVGRCSLAAGSPRSEIHAVVSDGVLLYQELLDAVVVVHGICEEYEPLRCDLVALDAEKLQRLVLPDDFAQRHEALIIQVAVVQREELGVPGVRERFLDDAQLFLVDLNGLELDFLNPAAIGCQQQAQLDKEVDVYALASHHHELHYLIFLREGRGAGSGHLECSGRGTLNAGRAVFALTTTLALHALLHPRRRLLYRCCSH